jgi:hypothetical protein
MQITLMLVLLAVLATWHYAIRCGFVSDDHSVCEKRKDIIPDEEKNPKKESYWVKVFNDGPVMYYWNAVMLKLKINNLAFIWHFQCLLIHLINCFLLFKLTSQFFGEQIALYAVVLWAVNPMLNQVTVWISGRPYSTALMLTLVAMLNYQYPLVFIPLYGLAVITNISVALVPIILKMMYPDWWQPNLYIFIMIFCGAPFIGWKFYQRFTRALVIDRENFHFRTRRFNTIARIFAYYVGAFILPVKMGWYHTAGFRYNEKWELFNVFALIGYLIIFLCIKQGWPGWWFILCLLPNANINATNSFVQDRYLYTASFGLTLIAAQFLTNIPHEIVFCMVTAYAVKAYMFSRTMINDEELYRENWRNHPGSDYAVNNLSYFLIQQSRYDEARVVIHRGLEVKRDNKMLWYNLGITWAAQGNFRNDEGKFRFLRALDCWKMCLQIEPRWAKPAEDIKKIVNLMIENKVLSLQPQEGVPGGMVVDLPNLKGLGVEGS